MLRLSLVRTTLPQDRWLSSQEPETVPLAEERGMQTVPVGSLGEAVALLKEGQVDAVVHDTPLLRHYLKNNPDAGLALAPQTFEIFTYGITYPGGQPMAGETRSSAGEGTGGWDIRRDACQMVRRERITHYSISKKMVWFFKIL